MNSYRICGLDVASDLLLAGAIEVAPGSAAPDVAVYVGPVPVTLEGAHIVGPNWQVAPRAFVLDVPGIARFLMRNGNSIQVDLAPDADPADAGVFLIGSAFGILLHQRGAIVLHASAVEVDGRAVLFCGASGAGKSTLAAALVARGYAMLSDDVSAIDMRLGEPLVHPDGRKLKLWNDAIHKLNLGEDRGDAVRAALEKYYIEPSLRSDRGLPLGAVYLIAEDRPPHAFGVTRPTLADAARLLRANAYRPRLVRVMGQQADYLNAAVAISARNGIHRLFRPLRFDTMPEVMAVLERHWSCGAD